MGETKQYAAFTIPKRETRIQRDESASAYKQAFFTDAPFAEIEYEHDFSSGGGAADAKSAGLFPSFVKAQPVSRRAFDPISERIYEMRRLASGNPFARNDAGLFYKQAKFMEDFTDDYPGAAEFSMYYPYYQHMRYEQLRTYFTWRARARRGDAGRTSLSYVFLYIYELLSHVGVSGPEDGLDKLVTLWQTYRAFDPALDNYVPRWLKDYNVYYELPFDFGGFMDKYGLHKFYPGMFITDAGAGNSLDLWNRLSGYDIIKSKFYTPDNEKLIKECFCRVMDDIRAFFGRRGARVEDMLVYSVYEGVNWYPFQKALFYNWLRQPDRRVVLPGGEAYICANNRWTANITVYYAGCKELVGYLLKKTESCLRQAVRYKTAITADKSAVYKAFQKINDLGVTLAEFDGVIEKAVGDFYTDMTRTVVTVDHANLARIRMEALGTQGKLIVPEGDAAQVVSSGVKLTLEFLPESPPESTTEIFADSTPGSSPESSQEPSAEFAPEPSPAQTFDGSPAEPFDEPLFEPPDDAYADGWELFAAALNAAERAALSLALQGGAGVRAFADESGVMLEVLIDSINEKAADHIGDNILQIDDNIVVYEEYRDKAAEMVKAYG